MVCHFQRQGKAVSDFERWELWGKISQCSRISNSGEDLNGKDNCNSAVTIDK